MHHFVDFSNNVFQLFPASTFCKSSSFPICVQVVWIFSLPAYLRAVCSTAVKHHSLIVFIFRLLANCVTVLCFSHSSVFEQSPPQEDFNTRDRTQTTYIGATDLIFSAPRFSTCSWSPGLLGLRIPVGRARYASQRGKLCSAPPAPEEHKTHSGAQSSYAARVKTRGA